MNIIDYRLPIISLLSNKIGKIRMKYKYEHESQQFSKVLGYINGIHHIPSM